MNLNKLTLLAIEEAKKSTFKIKLGAIIFDKNIIVSKGFNVKEKSVRSLRKDLVEYWSIHAEVSAILKAKTDLKGCSIIVVRVNNKGQLLLSKPCKNCEAYLRYTGIKKVYYSISFYPYITEWRL